MSQTLAQPTRTATGTTIISRPAVPEGFRAWLPALVILIGMPLLALATTKYVLIPSINQALSPSTISSAPLVAGQDTAKLFLAKIPFNVSGIKQIALVGADGAFKNKINQNKATLTSLARNDLNGITASDLYKPAVLESTRAKLLADFNHELGGPVVKDIYIGVWPEK